MYSVLGLSQAAPLRQSHNEIQLSRPKMIKGSICPLKRRAIFATNFTEAFVPKKIMQEFRCKFDYKRHNLAINTLLLAAELR